VLFFSLFLLIYLLSLLGNVLIVLLVALDGRLHTPMYFFICNLSLVELYCITQYYFFFSLAATELFILTPMAFDRYAAICRPFHYALLFSPQT
ncbi:Hypothetical predicted protein, partial [Marmota monax]